MMDHILLSNVSKPFLPGVQEIVYSISHLHALSCLQRRLEYENRCNEALLVIQPVVEQYQQIEIVRGTETPGVNGWGMARV